MHKRSFLAGVLFGAALAFLVVVAVPGLVMTRGGRDAPARAPVSNVVVVRNEMELPPRSTGPEETRVKDGVARDSEAAATESDPTAEPELSANLFSARVAAIATMRNIISAQAVFQACARADENTNGVGEYASFGEMSGAIGVRDGKRLSPRVLTFSNVRHGYVERSGYRFRMYLPQAGGRPVPERDDGGFAPREVYPELAETCWCCYAWPVEGDGEAFFTNQAGDVLATKGGWYRGDLEPPAYAAFQDASGLTAPTVAELPDGKGTGADGREWKPVG